MLNIISSQKHTQKTKPKRNSTHRDPSRRFKDKRPSNKFESKRNFNSIQMKSKSSHQLIGIVDINSYYASKRRNSEIRMIASQKMKLKLKKKVGDDLLRAFAAEEENGEKQRKWNEMQLQLKLKMKMEMEMKGNLPAIVMSDEWWVVGDEKSVLKQNNPSNWHRADCRLKKWKCTF